jgi:uncharacterized protein (TIGR03435 family)
MNANKRELLALGVFGGGTRLGERVAMLLERGREFSPRVSRVRVAVGAAMLLECVMAGAIAPRLLAFAQELKFDVASVRPNTSGKGGAMGPYLAGGRVLGTNVSLGMLVERAYQVFPFQIEGGPSWVNSDRFDVEGKATGTLSKEQAWLMLQSLLAERFKLALHRQTKETPVYELMLAKGGVKFKEGKCVGQPGPANPCGGVSGSRSTLMGRVTTVSDLASSLTGILGRVVIDKTKLTGKYDFDLHWTPDETALKGPGDPDAPPPDPNGPSIFTALQEQLGLELKATKGPVEMLVIDHAEKPDAN